MSQAYEQGKTGDYELHKLQDRPTRQVGSSSFGPCMTYKQAVERVQEQQMFTSNGSTNEMKQEGLGSKATTDHRVGTLTSHPFSMRPSQNAWKLSEVEKHRSFPHKMSVETKTLESHSFSSQASVAPTEPESPMSCDDISVFC